MIQAGYGLKYQWLGTETEATTNVHDAKTKVGHILLTEVNNEYIWNGAAWQEYKMRYKDLGLVIDAVNVAAGAAVVSAFYTNMRWVRNALIQVKSDQTHEIKLYSSTENQSTIDTGSISVSSLGASVASFRTSRISSVLGSAFKIEIRNTSASSSSYIKCLLKVTGI